MPSNDRNQNGPTQTRVEPQPSVHTHTPRLEECLRVKYNDQLKSLNGWYNSLCNQFLKLLGHIIVFMMWNFAIAIMLGLNLLYFKMILITSLTPLQKFLNFLLYHVFVLFFVIIVIELFPLK